MANFDFLTYDTNYSAFSQMAVQAELQYNKNTVFAAFAARKSLEQAVKWMYSVDSDLHKPYDDSIQVLVHESSFVNAVPSNIRHDMQLVIKVGNSGVHDTLAVEKKYVLLSLKALFNFLNWLDYTYGSAYQQRTFSEEAIPKNKVVVAVKKPQERHAEKDSASLEAFKKEIEAKDNTIEELKKQLAQALSSIQSNKENPSAKPELKVEDLSEFQTRKMFIDEDLKTLGWRIDGVQVVEEYKVDDMEGIKGKIGFIDYALFGKDGSPLAVVEAKKTTKDANVGKQQAVLYADCLERKFGRRPFIFYTNGFETFFWDDTQYAPRSVSMIFAMVDLQKLMDRRSLLVDLNHVQINRSISGRPYQMKAIRSICSEMEKRIRKFLLVMATGTGKTRTAISIVDVLSRGHYVSNVLFLADRIQLVEQAYDAFRENCPDVTVCNLLDPKDKAENKGARIVFSTYPTILNAIDTEKNKDGNRTFTPAHFDLIIVDEAHRSIFKKYRAIFEYFDAYLVGLTATPRRDVDKSTFEFFELQDDVPTDVYEYETAVNAGFLVPYHAIEKTSTFLDEGINKDNLSEEDLEKVRRQEEESEEPFEEIPPKAINEYVFNEDTTRQVLEDLMTKGIKTGGGDRLGKTIIFAYNKNHAQHIVDTFDKFWPQYKGKMCQRIVCDDSKVKSTIKEFKKSDSQLQIAVSVDMLDTGVDIPEVVNLVFYKKIRSKIKFWQMIGRGTRLAPNLVCTDETGSYVGKKYFYIFDYLRNFEFFREEKNGIEGASGKSVSERIFAHKCAVIKLLQDSKNLCHSELDSESQNLFLTYREQLVKEVHAQISALNTKLTPVHLVLKHVTKFQNEKSFECLSDEDVLNLSKHIAPLVFNEEADSYAKGFDNFCYGIMEAQLSAQPINLYRSKIKTVAEKLLQKTSIKAVRDHLPRLQRLSLSSYYDELHVLDYEEIRKEIRELAQFSVDNTHADPIFVDYDDNIKLVDIPEGSQNPSPADNFEEYKKKVDAYLCEHMKDGAINKLRTNQPLTKDDFESLNHIFKEELGDEKMFDQLAEGKTLGVFIRRATKMDKDAINDYFADFINDANMNALQIEFVQRLIDIIVEQGEINMEALMKGRAPFDRPKFFTLFGSAAQNRIFAIVKSINMNASSAA
ncbi:DEAD/DEAH box helicase family protein [Treponema sp. UBA3813]|uniref:DEAD/DEAH box helicase family protein n=1 Tax=Treponema sp. UBA3813 TaxID=1947715 RepID=UPI0025EC3D5B|nr:DEAD/DEAH box helicase family protein [Treponema sp. UBA3813]